MENVTYWRPERFEQIIGEKNRWTVRQLQAAAKERRPINALVLGPMGTAKTTICRLLMKSYVCQSPDPETADPCNRCRHCQEITADYNGEWLNYQHWEIDGTQAIGRPELSEIIQQARSGIVPPLLFIDELARLHEASAQAVFLTFVGDLKDGVFLAAAMTEPDRPRDRPVQVLPALFDRLTTYYFNVPEPEEKVALFLRQCPAWQIEATKADLTNLVLRAKQSFRTCLNILEEARKSPNHRLDTALIDEFLPPLDDLGCDAWLNPFSDEDK